jgi:hypothetical protein
MPVMAPGGDGTMRTRRLGGAVALASIVGFAWAAGGAAGSAAGWAGATRATDRAGAVRAARAAAAPPTLLATAPYDATGFLARPGFMTFDQNRANRTPDYLAGPGLTQHGFQAGRQPPIIWTHWGARAVGRASYWIGYHTPCHGCHYTPRVVSLAAWRVVDGRYTRFSITDLAGKGKGSTFDLATVSVPADGVAGGVPAYAWCNARDPRSCSPP